MTACRRVEGNDAGRIGRARRRAGGGFLAPALAAWMGAASGAAPATAHDYWIEPSTFRPRAGEAIALRHRVGEHLAGELVTRNPARIVLYEARRAGRALSIGGEAGGADPFGFLRLPEDAAGEGPWWILFQSNHARVELEPDRFAAYLAAEGLETIIDERTRRGESATPGREVYSRSAKASLCLDGPPAEATPGGREVAIETGADTRPAASAATTTTTTPLRIDISPLADPCALRAGAPVEVEVRFEGRPLAGTLVVATAAADAARPSSARTDESGRVRFELGHAGVWLIKTVHMIRHEGADSPAGPAEWESFWGSWSFELPAR